MIARKLERGIIEVEIAGNLLGACMKGGTIRAQKAGDETGGSMNSGKKMQTNLIHWILDFLFIILE